MASLLRAFRHPAYRLFYAGQFVSILGNWLHSLATAWLVYRLTGSALLLGITSAAQQLPMLFIAPVAGVWSDRLDRRKLLAAVQSVAAVIALTLAALTFTGRITPSLLVVLALVYGITAAVETPTRQAFLLELVGRKEELPNAIALQSMLFNGARFIAPSIAGILLATVGEAWCFALNGVSFLAVVTAYAAMRPYPRERPRTHRVWWTELAEGVRGAFGSLYSRRLLLLLAALAFFSAPWQSLMPIFAAETFGGRSETFGFLVSAVGLGALGATALLASRSSVRGLGKLIVAGGLACGAGLAAFGLSYSMPVSLAALTVFGFGLIAAVASTNTILQTAAEEHLRGRVIALYVTFFLGVAPFGNFAGGWLAERIGVHATLTAFGIALAFCVSLFGAGYERWHASFAGTRPPARTVPAEVGRAG